MARSFLLLPVLLLALAAPAHAGTWDPLETVLDARTGIAFDAAGADGRQAVAVRAGRSGAPLQLLARASQDVPFAAAAVPGSTARSVGPDLELAGDEGVLVWRQDTPRAYSEVRAALLDPAAGTIASPQVVAGPAAGGVRHPDVAIDEDGDAVLAFSTRTRDTHLNERGRVAVAVRRAGEQRFGRARTLTATPAEEPHVAMADGRAVVAWVRSGRLEHVTVDRGRVSRVRVLRRARGIEDLAVAVGPAGRAAVAWTEDAGGRSVLRVTTRRATGGFRTQRPLRASRTRELRRPDLAIDAQGRVLAAWHEEQYGARRSNQLGYNGVYARVWSARGGTDHGGFLAARPLSQPAGYASAPSVVATAPHRFALAWNHRVDDEQSGLQAVFLHQNDRPTVWRVGAPFSQDFDVVRRPLVLAARGGGATALWTADEARVLQLADGRP